MDSLISTFQIDLKLLIAQAINFTIVFLVLYFFAFKPLSKVMQERTKKIEKSLSDAEQIEKKLALTEEQYKEEIAKARKEAAVILEKAYKEADEKKKEMIVKAKEEIGQIINQEKVKMQNEKAQTLKDIKKEVAELVALSLEKVLDKKIDHKDDLQMIKKIIKA